MEPSDKSGGHYRELDLSGIRYPSDALSIAVLRQKYSASFDKGFDELQPRFFLKPRQGGHAEDVLGGLLCCERFVALFAYADATGVECPLRPGFDFKEELADLYMGMGIASGPHHAAELIRGIEQQAVQLANQRHP